MLASCDVEYVDRDILHSVVCLGMQKLTSLDDLYLIDTSVYDPHSYTY